MSNNTNTNYQCSFTHTGNDWTISQGSSSISSTGDTFAAAFNKTSLGTYYYYCQSSGKGNCIVCSNEYTPPTSS